MNLACQIGDSHGRSGRVAFPLTKLVLATEAALFEAPALKAERAALEVRNRVADMIIASIVEVIEIQSTCRRM